MQPRIHHCCRPPMSSSVYTGALRSKQGPSATASTGHSRLKAIEDIEVGDKVLSWDPVAQRHVVQPVERLYRLKGKPVLQVTCLDDGGHPLTITATEDHPFWVDNEGWVPACLLRQGDPLKAAAQDRRVRVAEVKKADRRQDVFNFEVRRVHNYFVGSVGILVHNMSDLPPTQSRPAPIAADGPATIGPETLSKGSHADPAQPVAFRLNIPETPLARMSRLTGRHPGLIQRLAEPEVFLRLHDEGTWGPATFRERVNAAIASLGRKNLDALMEHAEGSRLTSNKAASPLAEPEIDGAPRSMTPRQLQALGIGAGRDLPSGGFSNPQLSDSMGAGSMMGSGLDAFGPSLRKVPAFLQSDYQPGVAYISGGQPAGVALSQQRGILDFERPGALNPYSGLSTATDKILSSNYTGKIYLSTSTAQVPYIPTGVVKRPLSAMALAGLAGLEDGSVMSVIDGGPSGIRDIKISASNSKYGSGLYSPDDYKRVTLYLHRDYASLTLSNAKYSKTAGGQGMGLRSFVLMATAAAQAGIRDITLAAAGGPGQSVNGYYTWARFGFDSRLSEGMKSSLGPAARGFNQISQLMAQPGGPQLWKERGSAFYGVFDLRPSSVSWRTLTQYAATRGIQIPR